MLVVPHLGDLRAHLMDAFDACGSLPPLPALARTITLPCTRRAPACTEVSKHAAAMCLYREVSKHCIAPSGQLRDLWLFVGGGGDGARGGWGGVGGCIRES
jgi:hypothetical protein